MLRNTPLTASSSDAATNFSVPPPCLLTHDTARRFTPCLSIPSSPPYADSVPRTYHRISAKWHGSPASYQNQNHHIQSRNSFSYCSLSSFLSRSDAIHPLVYPISARCRRLYQTNQDHVIRTHANQKKN